MSRRPPRWAVWVALLVVGLAYELHEIKAGETGYPLSRGIRWVFQTHTPVGRFAFELAVERGSAWLVRHILADTIAESVRNDSAPAASSRVRLRSVSAGQA